MTVEIYLCKEGQALKEGKLEYSSSIDSKDDAASDALRRCQRDPTLKKVAYYRVSSDGEFRVFYSYTNPNCRPSAPKVSAPAVAVRAKKTSKPPPKKGLLARLKESIGF